MALTFSIAQLIIYFGIFNTVILTILLFFQKRNRRASKWLSLLMLCVSLNFAETEISHYLYKHVDWYYISRISLEYSFGFLFLFYIKNLLGSNFKITKKYLLFILPFALVLLYNIGRAFYVSTMEPFEMKQTFRYNQLEFLFLEGGAISYSLFCYVYSFMVFRKYRKKLRENFSSITKKELNWLIFIFLFFLSSTTLWIGYYVYEISIYPGLTPIPYYYPLWIFSIVKIVAMGYFNLLQPDLTNTTAEIKKNTSSKYKTSTLDNSQIDAICQQLKTQMETEKIYLMRNLTLKQVGEKMELPVHHVSQAINQGLEMNFYDFVNQYRVEEVKQRLREKANQSFTISALAFEAGFNSDNSFYKAFKKMTNQTPGQYAKSLKE